MPRKIGQVEEDQGSSPSHSESGETCISHFAAKYSHNQVLWAMSQITCYGFSPAKVARISMQLYVYPGDSILPQPRFCHRQNSILLLFCHRQSQWIFWAWGTGWVQFCKRKQNLKSVSAKNYTYVAVSTTEAQKVKTEFGLMSENEGIYYFD